MQIKTIIEHLREEYDTGKITPAEIAEELHEAGFFNYIPDAAIAIYYIGRGLISYNNKEKPAFVHIADYQATAPILSSRNYDIRPAAPEEVEMYNNGIYCYKIKE